MLIRRIRNTGSVPSRAGKRICACRGIGFARPLVSARVSVSIRAFVDTSVMMHDLPTRVLSRFGVISYSPESSRPRSCHGDENGLSKIWFRRLDQLTFSSVWSFQASANDFLIASACIWVGPYTVIMSMCVTQHGLKIGPFSRAHTDQFLLISNQCESANASKERWQQWR